MRKMPLRFARRVRNLEIKSSYYCPTKKKSLSYSVAAANYLGIGGGGRRDSGCSSNSSNYHNHHHHQQICPSCVLPIVVAFIFCFTVIQLIVIHRTIVAYKTRSLAFEEVYGPSHNDTKSQGDLLAFSKKFDSALLPIVINGSGGGVGGSGNAGGAAGRKSDSTAIFEWKPTGQAYPYRIPPRLNNINHLWTKVKCPEVSNDILGNISIDVKAELSLDSLSRQNPQVKPGGRWNPEDCTARFHVALIIPYRYRWNHLKLLLSVLHPMLRRQKMSYQIFVAEQFGNYTFNKGLLMNAAFLLALNSSAFDCVIFHDVDLLPETATNIYGCAKSPSHLSVSIDAYAYRLPYSKLVGGVFAISVEHFIQVNGYSNLYWGWGAEDDDMYKRLIVNQLPVNRPRPDLAKYKMLQHGRRVPNQFINPLIRTASLRFPQDGLTTCHFRLVSTSSQALFTHFLVDVGQPSWSILEPNAHLEALIPTSPSSAPLVPPHRTTNSAGIQKHAHSHQNHHNHHSGGNGRAKKNPELFMLTGIARDSSGGTSKQKASGTSGDRHVRSASNHHIVSPLPSEEIQQQRESSGSIAKTGNGNNHVHVIPLDPDVPVLPDEEEDEDDEDLQGDSEADI